MNRLTKHFLALVVTAGMVVTVRAAEGVGGGGSDVFSWFRFLAPFHMVLLHLPIGFFTVVALLEVWNWRSPSPERRAVTQMVLFVGVCATVVTMVLGFLRASDGGYDELVLRRHRGWGIAAAALMAIAWGLHRSLLRHPAPGGFVGFRVILFTGFVCLAVTGHHGGSLTHGVTLLTEHAPSSVRHFLGEDGSGLAEPGVAEGGGAYAVVRPVLAKKCFSCHGAEKQKGRLRLDERVAALKGGDSGRPAIVPGDPGRSEMIRAMLLPKGHDEVMPPEGKEALTPVELDQVVDWIRSGAGY